MKSLVGCVETGRKRNSEKHHDDRPMGKPRIAKESAVELDEPAMAQSLILNSAGSEPDCSPHTRLQSRGEKPS